MNELTVYLDSSGKKRLYEQIYEYITHEIRTGKLLCGERLPSTRSLAESLGISRSTVEFAYDQLQAEGYIEARPCRGYFVCRVEDLLQIDHAAAPAGTDGESAEKNEKKYQIDFSPNAIDMTLFPFETWRKITRNTLNDDRLELFSPGMPQGDLSLRNTISRYLHSARGVSCDPDRIIIGAGNDYLFLLLRYILGEKRTVAMENPTYQRAYRIFESMGYEMKTVEMDAQGMKADSLQETGADIAYVMPSHQYPTGRIMPIGRRMELLSWAAKGEERYLIEDDYDSEFRYHGKPIPSLQTSDKNGRVIYVGTFSKSIAPAIRISYMVLPGQLLLRYREKCSFLSSTVSRIDQATLNEFIRDGFFERYLNKMRKHYRQKHDMMAGLLRGWGPAFTITGENTGMHLLLTSRRGLTGREMVKRAAAMNIKIYAVKDYMRADEKSKEDTWLEHTVILGFGGLTQEQIQAGIKLLRICLN